MRRRRLCVNVTGALIFLTISASGVYADPIPLLSGGVFFSRLNDADFVASGNGVSTRAVFGNRDTEAFYPSYFCGSSGSGSLCAGNTYDLSDHIILPGFTGNSDIASVFGTITADGSTFMYDSLDLVLTAGTLTAPLDGTVRTPFSMAATAMATNNVGVTRTFDFSGQGTLSVFYSGNNGWLASSYTFEPPAATPEPTSLMLLGTGALGLLAGRRRRSA